MKVICVILLSIYEGQTPILRQLNVEGKVVNETQTLYSVDFREGVKKYNLIGDPEDYKDMFVKKTRCVKLVK